MASLIPKYLRAHHVDQSVSNTEALVWFMKVLYEFWGFCYNTPDSLTGSLGFPVGGVDMPPGFEDGSLLRTGSTGFTVAGESIFQDLTADFTSGSLKGKYLVAWKSGSTSNDDGIYKIRKIFGSSSMLVDTNMGATPYSASLEPLFDTRSNINYRIVDIHETATTISMVSGNGLVFEMSGANIVNADQLLPQFRVKFTENSGDNIELSWSPSGSWNGTEFGVDENIAADRDWANGSSGTGHITVICASDFMITHWKGTWNTLGSGFHIEVPKRLYPQEFDPNPIAVSNYGATGMGTSISDTSYGGSSWKMHYPIEDTVNTWRPLTIRMQGSHHSTQAFGGDNTPGNLTPGRYSGVGHNPILDKFFVSDIILAYVDSSQFWSMSRSRMRRWRITSNLIPDFSRMGVNGEWIKLTEGIMWPWDNAILPDDLMRSGF